MQKNEGDGPDHLSMVLLLPSFLAWRKSPLKLHVQLLASRRENGRSSVSKLIVVPASHRVGSLFRIRAPRLMPLPELKLNLLPLNKQDLLSSTFPTSPNIGCK
jgi:hypothetical protein